ncbi:MAG: hypothetical protein KIS68_01045 [Bauldia sp.]|nr:hypothetical protein [Bauldia sp.]
MRVFVLKACLVAAAMAGALMPGIAAAQVEQPPPGSPQRAAILDALRGQTIGELGGPIEFMVNDIRVLGEWAFVEVHPQRPGGGEIFYTYTRYQAAWDAGALDQVVTALLRETPAGWLVYEYDFGATDVVWQPWMTMYPVPPEVFPTGGAMPTK